MANALSFRTFLGTVTLVGLAAYCGDRLDVAERVSGGSRATPESYGTGTRVAERAMASLDLLSDSAAYAAIVTRLPTLDAPSRADLVRAATLPLVTPTRDASLESTTLASTYLRLQDALLARDSIRSARVSLQQQDSMYRP